MSVNRSLLSLSSGEKREITPVTLSMENTGSVKNTDIVTIPLEISPIHWKLSIL